MSHNAAKTISHIYQHQLPFRPFLRRLSGTLEIGRVTALCPTMIHNYFDDTKILTTKKLNHSKRDCI